MKFQLLSLKYSPNNNLKKIGKIPNIEMKYEQKKRDLFAKI